MRRLCLIVTLLSAFYSGFSQVPMPLGPQSLGTFMFGLRSNTKNPALNPDNEYLWGHMDGWTYTKRLRFDLNVYEISPNGEMDSTLFKIPYGQTIHKIIKANENYYFILSNSSDQICRIYRMGNNQKIANDYLYSYPGKILNRNKLALTASNFKYLIDEGGKSLYILLTNKHTIHYLQKIDLLTGTVAWTQKLKLNSASQKIEDIFTFNNRLYLIDRTSQATSFRNFITEIDINNGKVIRSEQIYSKDLFSIDFVKFSADGQHLFFSGRTTNGSYLDKNRVNDYYIAKYNPENRKMNFKILPNELASQKILWQDIIERNNELMLIGESFTTKKYVGEEIAIGAATTLLTLALTGGAGYATLAPSWDKIFTHDIASVLLNAENLEVINQCR